MKTKQIFLSAIIALSVAFGATAQVKVGNNPTTINAASVLEIESTNKGFLPPRMASGSSISNPQLGWLFIILH